MLKASCVSIDKEKMVNVEFGHILGLYVTYILHTARNSYGKVSCVLIKRNMVNVEFGHTLGSYVAYILHTARISNVGSILQVCVDKDNDGDCGAWRC